MKWVDTPYAWYSIKNIAGKLNGQLPICYAMMSQWILRNV
jgi:hypothetical protein